MVDSANGSEQNLILASEDFSKQEFRQLHRFSKNDERVIAKLIAHGPVLLQGSRGSGKSALLREAAFRLPLDNDSRALGIYISLRHMPLLTSVGNEYQRILCELLISQVQRVLKDSGNAFDASPNLVSVQGALSDLSQTLQKRLVIMFDDAAHIGREASLGDFFDVFRTLSGSTISCKATIYPGVTNFGKRFDVHNDATVIDVVRDEEQPGFGEFFLEVMRTRYPALAEQRLGSELDAVSFAFFLGKSVLGNMRSFLFLCNRISERDEKVLGFSAIGESFLNMASGFYWPLIEEVRPKLGKYEPVAETAVLIADRLLVEAGRASDGTRSSDTSVIIHRDIVSRLAKAFEILEYVGFISRREASRAMKSGGRGPRFALNLCMLLEHTHGTRLTSELFKRWLSKSVEALQIHVSAPTFQTIKMPDSSEVDDLEILDNPVDSLRKAPAYPYGLSDRMIEKLHEASINTIRELYEAPDAKLDAIPQIGDARVKYLRNVVAQAVWL